MAADSPSTILSRAADLIRDTAAAATPGPWSTVSRFDGNGNLRQADFTRPPVAEGCAPQTRAVRPHEVSDYEWIALMSPAVAGPVSEMLRRAASDYVVFVAAWESRPRPEGEVARLIEDQFGGALALARAVLGEKEEQ